MKHIVRLLLLTLCLLLTASAALALPENYVVRNGSRDVPKVAITVDDGWDLSYVRKIHDLCVEMDFPITWFMVGTQFRHEDKAMWEEVIAHGSEIGNHTWRHSRLLKFNISNGHPQTRLVQERVDEVLGYHYPLRLMRPPYGEYKNAEKNFLPIFEQYGVEKVILWDVSQTNAQKAFKSVKNGSILLYHTREADYQCIKQLVPMLREAGYQLVTVSELLELEPLVLPVPTATPRPAVTPEPTAAPAAATAAVPAQSKAEKTAVPTAAPTPVPADELTKEDVVAHGDRSVNKIAVTIDDCNDPEIVKQLHALSVELDVPLTYFVIGNQFRHEDKALWEEILAHGSELGNHTWKHSELTKYSISNGHTQVRLTQERVDEVLGYHYPLRLMRPPRGAYQARGKNFLPVFQEHGIEKVILWDVDQNDPDKALKETQNGSILLYETTQKDVNCLKELLPMLKDAGYELVTVSELLDLPVPKLNNP